ncbi:MAG: carboxymethylenebutenolidase [Caulobacterales bacterium 68-7]|nr:dienelactone hydrolase family protein [Caulobacterales bacterium]OJU13253.1 MAG: carboxymethylenebutenolidase [Caulobacterales bacterium 68-7]
MSETITFTVPDGAFSAYVARPDHKNGPAVVVIQEIFGVNAVMRGVCDALAAQGYLAVCPDLFWRLEPGVDITDQTQAEWDKALDLMGRFDVDQGVNDLQAVIAAVRDMPECDGKVGTVGYCLGGKLAFLVATRTDADASVSYYGVGLEPLLPEIESMTHPLLVHIAGEDGFTPPDSRQRVIKGLEHQPMVTVHVYPGRDHAFARPGGKHYDADDATLAEHRSLAFFKAYIG